MGKFFKKQKKMKLSDEQKIKMAENEIGRKINTLADFIESQKDWNITDAYVILRFTLENSIIKQIGKNKKALKIAQDAYKAIEIKEEIK